MPFGSRAPYAKQRNEQAMRRNLKESGRFPDTGPTSTAWLHKKMMQVQRGNEGNVARTWRIAQENLQTSRLDEERAMADLTANRRPALIGEGGRVRAAQRAAEQVYNVLR